jgi:hypothetical protein
VYGSDRLRSLAIATSTTFFALYGSVCMFQNVLAKQCRLCARLASKRGRASNVTVTTASTSVQHHQNFGTSARWSRQLPKGGPKASRKGYSPSDPPNGASSKRTRDAYRAASDNGHGSIKGPYSAFKLSSETPETPTTGAGPVALDKQAILDALRAKQEDLLGKSSQAGPGKRGSMVAILEAMAVRLALDKVELLRLAKVWAKNETYPEKVDRKGKGRSINLDDDL